MFALDDGSTFRYHRTIADPSIIATLKGAQCRQAPEHMEQLPAAESDEIVPPSERSFGFVFAGFFLLVAIVPGLFGGRFHLWALFVSVGFGAAAFLRPGLLAPMNRVWLKFGLLLHKVISPIALGVIFFGAIFPTGLAFRLLRKDPLRLRFDSNLRSYWIPREAAGKRVGSMRDQF